jgi:predicted transcriptional regulator
MIDERGLTVEELCRLCDVSPSQAERAIENLLRRGLIEEVNPSVDTTQQRESR